MVQFDPLTFARVIVPAASGLIAVWAGVAAWRRGQSGEAYVALARPFAVLGVGFGVVGVGYAAVRAGTSLGAMVIFVGLYVVMVPWTVFTLRYVGREGFVTRRRRAAAWLFGAVLLLGSTITGFAEEFGVSETIAEPVGTLLSLISLSILIVLFALLGLVMLSTYRHRRLSVGHGALVVLPLGELLFAVQTTRPGAPVANDLLTAGSFAAIAVTLAVGTSRYNLLSRLPGTQARGEWAALTETNEAILILDSDGRVIRTNRSADELFGQPARLADATDYTVSAIRDRETITCWTKRGSREFDPRVSTLTNDYDETLGYTVTLIDVTKRELRRQRLQVLNRILRHNVRNRLDVIRAHAETAELPAVTDTVDQLDQLSTEARRIERLVGRGTTDEQPTELASFLPSVARPAADGGELTLSVSDLTITLDRTLCRYAVRNLVENAVEHNDAETPRVELRASRTETGVRIVVADDGPGIPEGEQAVIVAGTERPLAHASSLGLWGTNWAVQTMGGTLSFGDSELGGSAVVIELPERV